MHALFGDSSAPGAMAVDDPRQYSMSNQTPGACTLPQPSHRRPASHDTTTSHNLTARSSDGLFSSTRSRQFSTHDRLFQTIETGPRKTYTNKPDRTLYVDDIDGARAKRADFHTERVVNPLEPKYKLPSCEVLPPPAPKFIRDSIKVDDIDGTKPPALYKWAQRDTFGADDIEGAKAGWKPRHKLVRKRGEPRDYMDTSDISGPKRTFQRESNLLEPRYEVHGLVIEDDPIKSRPKALPKAKNSPYFTLYTADIEGAQPGWIPEHKIVPKTARISNNTKDIPGAQADTLKRVLQTQRQVDPLDPAYTSLDGYALEAPFPRFYQPETPAPNKPSATTVSATTPTVLTESQRRTKPEATDLGSNNSVVVPTLSPMPTTAAISANSISNRNDGTPVAGLDGQASAKFSCTDGTTHDDLPDDPLAGIETIFQPTGTISERQSISAPSAISNKPNHPIAFTQPARSSREHEALRPTITNRSREQTVRAPSPRPPAVPRSTHIGSTPRSASSARPPATPKSLRTSSRKTSRSYTPRSISSRRSAVRPMSVEEKKCAAELENDIALVKALA